jgi:hypothetical protein
MRVVRVRHQPWADDEPAGERYGERNRRGDQDRVKPKTLRNSLAQQHELSSSNGRAAG